MTRAQAPAGAAFETAEYEARLARAREAMAAAKLDAVVLFAQESLYYLTGFDSGGYVFFQAAVLTTVPGDIVLLTRIPDRAQARATSIIPDVRVWLNAEDADPAGMLADILREKGLAGGRVGLELDTYGLTGRNHAAVTAAVDGLVGTTDASELLRRLRLIKSPAEIAYVREAAALADRALDAMLEAAVPGVPDSALASACLHEILLGGGDMPPAGPLVNSGERAPFGRGVGGPRRLEAQDQVVVEYAATRRRYNVCLEATIALGPPADWLSEMHEAVREALDAMIATARPGVPLGEIDVAHRRVLDARGFAKMRFAACGYSLGATYRPSWMDVPPMLYAGNPEPAAAGMVLFPHAILGDAASGRGCGVGRTILIGPDGAEVLSRHPIELLRA